MTKAKPKFETLFFIFLICSPLLDIATGIQFYLNSEGELMRNGSHLVVNQTFSLSLIVRMAMMVFMAVYVIYTKQHKILVVFGLIGVSWAITAIVNFSNPNFDFIEDLLYICKFSFNLLSLLAYWSVFSKASMSKQDLQDKIDKILCWTILIVSVAVIIPYFFGVGYYTYSDKLGYRGCRGFFFSGNDVTALLMLLLPVSFAMLQKYANKANRSKVTLVLFIITPACATVSLLIIGTKTAFLAVGATYIAIFIYQIINAVISRDTKAITLFGFAVLATLIVYFIAYIITKGDIYNSIVASFNVTGDYAKKAGAEAVVFSGRTEKLKNAIEQFISSMPISALFGISRGTQKYIIEMDIPEVFLYYGLIGTVTMLWIYVKNGIQVIYNLFKNFSYTIFCCAISLGLTFGYLTTAGHTLFSVTSGFYFAFVLLYSRMFTNSKNANII